MAQLLDRGPIAVARVLACKESDMSVRPSRLVTRQRKRRHKSSVLDHSRRSHVGHVVDEEMRLPNFDLKTLVAESPEIVATIY